MFPFHAAEEEKETGIFSPQFNAQACNHRGDLTSLSTMDFKSKSPSDSLSTRKGESYANLELLNSDSQVQDDGVCTLIEIGNGNSEVNGNVSLKENTSKQVSVSDMLCLACKQLLFRPVVLNCGHGIELQSLCPIYCLPIKKKKKLFS